MRYDRSANREWPKETAPAWVTPRPKFGASFVPMGGPTQLMNRQTKNRSRVSGPVGDPVEQDVYSDCTMIRAEIEGNNQKAKQLADKWA